MTAVLGLSPPQESTKMTAHNRLMEREWGFGYPVFILAHHQLENPGMLSGELSVEFVLQEPEVKMRPVLATQWVPGKSVLQSETLAQQNKTKQNRTKRKEIFWECLGSSEKCPISEGDSKYREILFLMRWGHLAFPWDMWKSLQFGEKLARI